MPDVNVIIFIESPIVKTLLFECSKYWATEGCRVHYISSHAQETLPPFLQGTNSNVQTYAQFMQITFGIAPQVHDLIDYLINLQKSPQLPKVLVLEDITGYTENASETDFLLMCSLLKNLANLCSQANNELSFLIVSSKFIPNKLNKINLILNPSKIWRCLEENSNYILREISLNPVINTTTELQFCLKGAGEEGVLRLNSIKSFFEKTCNFNNSIL